MESLLKYLSDSDLKEIENMPAPNYKQAIVLKESFHRMKNKGDFLIMLKLYIKCYWTYPELFI